ncbi:hypothetical protein [Amaricoccus sp.]|uniref:hypothetical protein n=1 Tax=Amaricoccus sp. TaxID=1872485 RepID=UPI001B5FD928|nr:hypothetical protein [Amaricoccus sp.]MBP7001329.1 hypothetical protein [Amaricoccus sp.]
MRSILLAAAAAIALAGCDSLFQREVSHAAEVSATVTAVRPATRSIDLATASGETLTLTASPDMRNFDQIEPGDVATLQMFGSMSVRVADSTAPNQTDTFALIGRAPKGERPGSIFGAVTTTTVTFVSYDPRTFEAVVTLPSGERRAVRVQPGMRAFAAARTPGERIEVTISDAVALFVDAPA